MIIDLIACGIALLCVGVGWSKGFMKMMGRLVVCGLALVCAFMLAPVLSETIYSSLIEPNLTQIIDDKIEEFGATETVATIYAEIQKFSASDAISNVTGTIGNSLEAASGALSGIDFGEIAGIDWDSLPDLGDNDVVKWISKFSTTIDTAPLEDLLKQTQGTIPAEPSSVSSGIVSVLEPPITGLMRNIIFVIVLLVVNLLGNFVWELAGKLATDTVKPLKTADRALGAACGLVLGLTIWLDIGAITYALTSGNTDSFTAQASNTVVGLFTDENIVSSAEIITNTRVLDK